MASLPEELRALIATGPLAHLSTVNRDGSPHVNVIWIGLDGDQIVSGHMSHKRLVRNIEREARVVLSFAGPRDRSAVLNPYAVISAHATVEASDSTWDLLNDLTKIYVHAGAEFPAPRGPGYLTRYRIEHIGGVGPWVAGHGRAPGGTQAAS